MPYGRYRRSRRVNGSRRMGRFRRTTRVSRRPVRRARRTARRFTTQNLTKRTMFNGFDVTTSTGANVTRAITFSAASFSGFAQYAALFKKYRVRGCRVSLGPQAGFVESHFEFTTANNYIVSWKDPTVTDGSLTNIDQAMNKMGAKHHPVAGFRRRAIPVTTSTDASIPAQITNRSPWFDIDNNTTVFHAFNVLFPAMSDAGAGQIDYDAKMWVDFEFWGRKL